MDEFDGESMRAIGRRLELARSVLGLQQNEFALAAGIQPTTYNQIENGKKMPGLDKARKLKAKYGISLDWIYQGDLAGMDFKFADAIKGLRAARLAPAAQAGSPAPQGTVRHTS